MRIDYDPVIQIQAVKSKQATDLEGIARDAVFETLKYGVKESDLLADADWLAKVTTQLHKTRAVSVGGVLRKFISEEEPTDLIHDEGDSAILALESLLWFQWHQLRKRYVKSERSKDYKTESEWKQHDIPNVNYSDIE